MNKRDLARPIFLIAFAILVASILLLAKHLNIFSDISSDQTVNYVPPVDISSATNPPSGISPLAAETPQVLPSAPFFAHYYIWWDDNHWRSKLGSNYPRASFPLPLPATLVQDGCTATTPYAGNTLLDVPAPNLNLYTQDNPATFTIQVSEAANAGLFGFIVSWAGNGQNDQNSSSTAFNRRLAALVNAVNNFNGSHPQKFRLMIGYEGLDDARNPRPDAWIMNDWQYFIKTYENNPAFQLPRYSTKPIFMFLDSRKFSVSDLATITTPYRNSLYLLGDEHGVTEWNRGVSSYFDGDGWYFSSQNPYMNASSFSQLRNLSSLIKSEGKLWFSPLSAGYNKSNFNIGGGCVPRESGKTLQLNYAGNKTSNPDGWMYISWNEYFENTYIEPSLRYGDFYLRALQNIIFPQN